jgi:uncharacterized OsmC-like protein
MAIMTFKAESRLKDGLSVESTAGKFTVLMDEPETLRGTDTGMNPVEMLLCSLGACQCIVARLFAKAQRIKFEEFRVELEGDLDTDGFLRGKDDLRPGLSEIRYTLHIKTDASREKVEDFAAFIKKRCPVSDVIVNGTTIIQKEVVHET